MYIVIELQKNGNTVANIVTTHETLNNAESKFHSILAAAAESTVEKHSAVLMSDEGFPMRNECYKHEVVATPTEEHTTEE